MSSIGSLSNIFNIATSGLQTAQTQINITSQNISNVNTPGYVRKIAEQQSLVGAGAGGVEVTQITRAANQYLQQLSLQAGADSSRYGAISTSLDQIQSMFGNPGTGNTFFDQLDNVFSGFQTAASTGNTAGVQQALTNVQQFFSQANQIGQGITTLETQNNDQITKDVNTANNLLKSISDLNNKIVATSSSSGDITGYQDQQSQYIDQLSQLMDIKVTQDTGQAGAVTIRASDGTALTSLGFSPASLSYDQSNGNGQITFTPPAGKVAQAYGTRLTSGEIYGLLQANNTDLPNLAGQLGNFTSAAATLLNQVSNSHTAFPAPNSLTGKDTGVDFTTALSGFSGKTNIAVVNSSGVVQQAIAVDFTAKTITIGSTTTSFTPANFISTLNTASGGACTASLSGNVLSLTATTGNGISIGDDSVIPSQNGGKGFSQYFGLNDLVTSTALSDYNTGLSSTSTPDFSSGSVTLRISNTTGVSLANVTITPTSGQTLGALITQLNNSTTGLGLYGQFNLDSKGALSFTPRTGSGVKLTVPSDTTALNGTGPSLTTVFGIDPNVAAARSSGFSLNAAISQNPSLLPKSNLNLSVSSGQAAITIGDVSGLSALATAGQSLFSFPAIGQVSGTTTSLSSYAASFSGQIGTAAANADNAQKTAAATATEAQNQRSNVEGVNLDNELINLTTYQQSYSAVSRLITAGRDMFDALLQIIQ